MKKRETDKKLKENKQLTGFNLSKGQIDDIMDDRSVFGLLYVVLHNQLLINDKLKNLKKTL